MQTIPATSRASDTLTLGEAGVPCSAILDTKDLYEDPHLRERGFVESVEHRELGEAPLLGFPTRMSASRVEPKRAPYLGEHSDEVLRADLGLDDAALGALHEDGIVGGADGRREP